MKEIELIRLAAALRDMPDEPVESVEVASSWLQYDDGTWSPVYESGRVGAPFSFAQMIAAKGEDIGTLLHALVDAGLVTDVAPTGVEVFEAAPLDADTQGTTSGDFPPRWVACTNDSEQVRSAVVGFNWRREPDSNTVEAIAHRIKADQAEHDQIIAERRRQQIQAEDSRAADSGLWAHGWPHEAPDRPLSVKDAHMTMQRHRGCHAQDCPRKDAARQALIAAGRMKPDASREY